ncbi:hypothetical protein BJ508DRAFT_333005 [Ascobolus immersus RN42]|uniref:Uncharacterized protein n=1 Tax=Ascobolus immersus RN42 TaxID=1160509 RepID=A0A3N4HXW5_ASCIM|nr:hypothetical protein BJ508DRAFT_333005 [Ascobolus immersus RN42]
MSTTSVSHLEAEISRDTNPSHRRNTVNTNEVSGGFIPSSSSTSDSDNTFLQALLSVPVPSTYKPEQQHPNEAPIFSFNRLPRSQRKQARRLERLKDREFYRDRQLDTTEQKYPNGAPIFSYTRLPRSQRKQARYLKKLKDREFDRQLDDQRRQVEDLKRSCQEDGGDMAEMRESVDALRRRQMGEMVVWYRENSRPCTWLVD